ncbi:acetyltransferase [Metabacillus indicus]|uniref:acetyltransferase n=1 Tax=Metabacillus indicus TaxID=246786 RepID=UPI002A092838|nr:acetyltransferase [Metabacillus indicus]MDX8289031.1 acetyltransferase [Metabacillus indicus]
MGKFVVFGTGGFAREVHEIIEYVDEQWSMVQEKPSLLGFLDGNIEMHGKEVHGLPVLGGLEWLERNKDVGVVVAIGNPGVKRKIVQQIKQIGGINFPSIIDPRAVIGARVKIGEGCIICANTIITTDILIKDFVILNISCTIGHDTTIEDYVTIAPGANISGNVDIKEGTDIGTATAIIQGKTIGAWSIIGAGAVVVKDVPNNVTAVGNPSKVIKEREEKWQLQY